MNIIDFIYDKKLKKDITNKEHRKLLKSVLIKEQEKNENKDEKELEDIYNYIMTGYKSAIEYRNLLKIKKIHLEDFMKGKENPLKSFELFNDTVQKLIIESKAKKLKHRIISKKHESLCDKETDKIFIEMAQMDFTKKELQDFVGKKISAFTYSEELNGALMNLMEIKFGWSNEAWLKRIKDSGLTEGSDYEMVKNENNEMLLNIHSFEASKALGSKMWCITRENYMFEHYQEDLIFYQFYYDFNKDASNDESMTAVLSRFDGEPDQIYTKADKEILKDYPEEKHTKKIIKNIRESNKGCDDWESILNKYEKNTLFQDDFGEQMSLDFSDIKTIDFFFSFDPYILTKSIDLETLNKYSTKKYENIKEESIKIISLDIAKDYFKNSNRTFGLTKKVRQSDLLDYFEIIKSEPQKVLNMMVSALNNGFEPEFKTMGKQLKKHFNDISIGKKVFSNTENLRTDKVLLKVMRNSKARELFESEGLIENIDAIIKKDEKRKITESLFDGLFDWDNKEDADLTLNQVEYFQNKFLKGEKLSFKEQSITRNNTYYLELEPNNYKRFLNIFHYEGLEPKEISKLLLQSFVDTFQIDKNPDRFIENLIETSVFYKKKTGQELDLSELSEILTNDKKHTKDLLNDFISRDFQILTDSKSILKHICKVEDFFEKGLKILNKNFEVKIDTNKLLEGILMTPLYEEELQGKKDLFVSIYNIIEKNQDLLTKPLNTIDLGSELNNKKIDWLKEGNNLLNKNKEKNILKLK